MYRLAIKMLFGDTAKYLMLVVGIIFATFLITQQVAVFCGLLLWTSGTVQNVPAPLWIVEEQVEQINETNPMRDTDVAAVRSVDEVAWAMPLFSGLQKARLSNGNFKMVQLLGIDGATLAGGPMQMIEGRLEDLRLPNTVIIDELGVKRLSLDKATPVKIGDTFEINDQEARVVGICKAQKNFTNSPFIWTTYERSLQYSPPQRKMLSVVIAAPKPGINLEQAAQAIEARTGLRCYVNDSNSDRDFGWATIWWYVKNTGIPYSFGTTVIVGFIVGIAISCQTFYAFVLENMKHLGALKAMGTSTRTLCGMLILQALTVGFVGYGIGIFLLSGFAAGALKAGQPPFYMTWHIPVYSFGVILFICSLAALIGIFKVSRVEPAMVFRG